MPSTTVLESDRQRKRRFEILLGRFILNPLIRGLFRLGVSPPLTLLLETTGRKSGLTRHTPLNYSRDGERIWVIAQHGTHAGWVRNLQAQPEIRVRLGRTWHDATASLVPEDDVRARARTFIATPVRGAIAAAMFRALESDPVSLAIDLH